LIVIHGGVTKGQEFLRFGSGSAGLVSERVEIGRCTKESHDFAKDLGLGGLDLEVGDHQKEGKEGNELGHHGVGIGYV